MAARQRGLTAQAGLCHISHMQTYEWQTGSWARKKRRRQRRNRSLAAAAVVMLVAVVILLFSGHRDEPQAARDARSLAGLETFSRKDLRQISPALIDSQKLAIDWDMQQYLARVCRDYKVDYAAITIMDARTGEILALYGKTPAGEDNTECLKTFEAASIFKVVTATAALEHTKLKPSTVFQFHGRGTTLYKNQLEGRGGWVRECTMRDAFAHSNNVVFGRIGRDYLGEQPILLTAFKYGFWQSPLDEVECDPSTVFIPENDFNVAELASGFNTGTRVSSVHAAQIASAILNDGRMLKPHLRRGRKVESEAVMSVANAQTMQSMMETTIVSGTMAKDFRGANQDRVLKYLRIGAKSGSIEGKEPRGWRKWFLGYAEDENTGQAITIGCVLVRGDYFWIEADGLTRLIIRRYFANQGRQMVSR